MNKFSLSLSALFCICLTACGGNNFNQNDLPKTLYQGYWAMRPFDGQHRVLKFHPNGSVKIYDYICHYHEGSYSLNETETVYLNKKTNTRFELLDEKKKSFALFEILRLTSTTLQARQFFADRQVTPNIVNLSYTSMIGAKPICSM